MFRTNYYLIFINLFSLPLLKANNEVEHGGYVPRVVNGTPGRLGDAPYQIAFKVRIKRSRIYSTFCGGVIIGQTKLLSAAHCFSEKPNFCEKICGGSGSTAFLSDKFAVAGNLNNHGYHNELDSDKDGQWRKMKSVYYPKTYEFPKDDIAVVFTYKPFNYNTHVDQIPYASKLIDYTGKCLVSGYGRTSITKSQTSKVLLLALLELVPMAWCNKLHRKNMRKFVCTTSKVTFSDVGKGDSGGPLVCRRTDDPKERGPRGILVGIVSGHRYNVGSFFTRVSSYRKFIDGTNCACTNLENKIFCLITIIQVKSLLFSFSFI